jgi:hypothetical protein
MATTSNAFLRTDRIMVQMRTLLLTEGRNSINSPLWDNHCRHHGFALNFLGNQKFLIMVFAAAVSAVPVALAFGGQWHRKFAFKIQVGPGILILSILITLAVVFVAVSANAIKLARANPVDSLRHK